MTSEWLTIDRLIGVMGIAATLAVAGYIYVIQRKAQVNMDKILNRQSVITNSFENRRKNRIEWLHFHVGHRFNSLKKAYLDLLKAIDKYQKDKSDENLTQVFVLGNGINGWVDLVYEITEREISNARDYITDTWFVTKILDAIPLLKLGTFTNKSQIKEMNFSNYIEEIQSRLSELEDYITRLEKEKKTLAD